MDALYAILFFGAIFGVVILWNKATGAASKAVNRKILYRSEYEEGRRMTAGLTVTTKASIPEIMDQLTSHVVTSDAPLGFNAVVYEESRGTDRIAYAFGNKLVPTTFRAVVGLSARGDTTMGVFAISNWKEREGLIVAQDQMREVRKQVKAAFKAADASAQFTARLADDEPPTGGELAAATSSNAESGSLGEDPTVATTAQRIVERRREDVPSAD